MAAPLNDSLALLAESNPDIVIQPAAAAQTDDASAAPSAAAVAAAAPAPAAAVERSGFMLKNSYHAPDQFKRYFFRLDVGSSVLTYSDSPSSGETRGKIELEGCSCDITPESKYGLAACFELNSPLQSRIYALGCDNLEELQGWINVLRKAMLKIRRQKAKEAAKKKRDVLEGAHQDSQAQQAGAANAAAAAAAAQPSVTAAPSAASSAENSVNSSNSYSSAPVSSNASSAYAAPNPYNPDRTPAVASSNSSAVPVAAAAGVGVVAAVGAAALLSSSASSSAQQQQSQPQRSNGGFNSAAAGAGGVAAMSQEDKYTVYRQWIDETKQSKDPAISGGGRGGSGKSVGRSSGAHQGGELHHTLLEEENKRKSVFETWCGCCPAWCFQ